MTEPWMPSDEEIRASIEGTEIEYDTEIGVFTDVRLEPIRALISAAVEKAIAAQEAFRGRLLPMARFGMKCFDEHRDQLGDLDGSDLQEWAESFGLLHEVHVIEPCCELCRCVEWDDFPQECLRETGGVTIVRAELAALESGK